MYAIGIRTGGDVNVSQCPHSYSVSYQRNKNIQQLEKKSGNMVGIYLYIEFKVNLSKESVERICF